ncbi:hypothetical protein Leryth_025455 [Lithospermum erythrorhizon]|nr:hypothetical protein Leryth_025455 [Lithospermum erythrorhizon]
MIYLQGLWVDRESQLWMLPCMTEDLIISLNKKGFYNVNHLMNVQLGTLQTITESSIASSLYEDLQRFPLVRVQVRVQSNNSESSKAHRLNVTLEVTNSRRRTSRAFTPRFPKV